MARTPTVTAEEVVEAAEKLLAAGETPSVRKVREILGTGSNVTIQTFLHNWQAKLPAQEAPALGMSEGFATAIRAELQRIHEQTVSESAESLARAKAALKAAENEIATLQDQLEQEKQRASDHYQALQQAEGRCAELVRQVEALKQDLQSHDDAARKLAAAEAKLSLLEPRAAMSDELQKRVATLEAQQANRPGPSAGPDTAR